VCHCPPARKPATKINGTEADISTRIKTILLPGVKRGIVVSVDADTL